MHTLPEHRRILLLTGGSLGVHTSKTAAALLRYRADDVVAVVDSAATGRDIREIIPWAPPVPILSDVDAAEELQPDALYIGISPPGGDLPRDIAASLQAALRSGLDVVSGLHVFLADDTKLAAAAQAGRATIYDLRRPPANRRLAGGRTRTTRSRRVLTVGTDGNVGKMITALELTAAARAAGHNAQFLATGQTGIAIVGQGVCIDACVADFAAGAAEDLVLSAADSDFVFIEGQGSLGHPGFSAVTLALLHGTCPDALILVHALGRNHHRVQPDVPLPDVHELIAAYERTAALLHPARIVGVALNTHGHDANAAALAMQKLEADLRLPVEDPFRPGCTRLLNAALGGV